MSLASRLKLVEAASRLAVPVIDPVAESKRRAAEQAMEANWQIMAASMSDEHLALLIEVKDLLNREGEESAKQHSDYPLFKACRDALWQESYRQNETFAHLISPQVALAMPAVLGQNLIDVPGAHLRIHDCECCGFRVPMLKDRTFDACPLCGGKLGWYAFFSKH